MKKKFLLIALVLSAIFCVTAAGCFGLGTGSDKDQNQTVPISYTDVTTADELYAIEPTGNYRLTADIDISAREWSPINNYSGVFEGDNHTITGLKISGKDNTGMFSTLKGTVKNLKITDAEISASGDAGTSGIICGTCEGKIENVTVNGKVDAPYYNNLGGICGKVAKGGNLKGCKNYASVTGYQYVGGIAGYFTLNKDFTSSDNENYGEITGKNCVGGIAGQIQGGMPDSRSGTNTLSNSKNCGKVTGTGNYTGGLVGYVDSEKHNSKYVGLIISGSQNTAEINGGDYTGGIVGTGSDKLAIVTASKNTADITGGNYTGGYLGYANNATVKLAINSNTVTGKAYVGGVAGWCTALEECSNAGNVVSTAIVVEGSQSMAFVGGVVGRGQIINDCKNESDITVTTGGLYVGGIVGYLYMPQGKTISGNENTGNVSGKRCVGGIAGQMQGETPSPIGSSGTNAITDNVNRGTVTGTDNYAGGLTGYLSSNFTYSKYQKSTVSGCTNSGLITGEDYTAGLIGYTNTLALLSASFNTADIKGGNYTGGYAGYADGTTIRLANNSNKITGKAYLGGIAGWCTKLYDCTNSGEIISKDRVVEDSQPRAFVGGIVGRTQLVSDCKNEADITVDTAGRFVGGIAGYIYALKNQTISGNENTGKIDATFYMGGIAGQIQAETPFNDNPTVTIKENKNSGYIKAAVGYAGGIAGYVSSNTHYSNYATLIITSNENTGTIDSARHEGNSYDGQIIGYGKFCEKSSSVWESNICTGDYYGALE